MTEFFVEGLKPADEIGDFFSRIRATSLGAEMGATAEGAVFVNGASAITAKLGARTIGMRLYDRATGCADTSGREERLRACDLRRFAGEAKMTAAGAQNAVAMERPALNLGVDRAQFGFGSGIERGDGWLAHERRG